MQLVRELADTLSIELSCTAEAASMEACDRMLVYLTSLTWTQGEASALFAAEVQQAMDKGVPLLLAHEMPGIGGQEARHAVDFGAFFACSEGTTPHELLQKGIYNQIAIALKGGPWRHASLMVIAKALASVTQEGQREVVEAYYDHAARAGTLSLSRLQASRKNLVHVARRISQQGQVSRNAGSREIDMAVKYSYV